MIFPSVNFFWLFFDFHQCHLHLSTTNVKNAVFSSSLGHVADFPLSDLLLGGGSTVKEGEREREFRAVIPHSGGQFGRKLSWHDDHCQRPAASLTPTSRKRGTRPGVGAKEFRVKVV